MYVQLLCSKTLNELQQSHVMCAAVCTCSAAGWHPATLPLVHPVDCYVAPCAPCGHVSVCSRCPQWPLKRCICSRTLPLFKMRSATGNLHHCVCFINIPVLVYSLWSKSGNMYLVCVGRPPFCSDSAKWRSGYTIYALALADKLYSELQMCLH